MNNNLPSDHGSLPAHSVVPHAESIPEVVRPIIDGEEANHSGSSGSINEYWHAFRRRWFMALFLGIFAAAATSATVWVLYGDRFTAMVQFIVAPNEDPRKPGIPSPDFQIVKNSQEQYITSDYVLNFALRDKALIGLPVLQRERDQTRWLAQQIRVTFPGNGAEMNVTVTTPDARQSALLMAAVTKSFLTLVVDQETETREKRIQELEATLADKTKARDQKQAELKRISEELGAADSQTASHKQRMLEGNLAFLRQQLIDIRFRIKQMEVELEQKKADLLHAAEAAGEDRTALLSELDRRRSFANDETINRLNMDIESLSDEKNKLQTHATPAQRARRSQEIDTLIQKIKKQIQERQQKVERELVNLATMSLDDDVAKMEFSLKAAQAHEKDLTAQEAQLLVEAEKFGGSTFEMDNLQRDVSILDASIEETTRDLQKAKEEYRLPSRVTRATLIAGEKVGEMIPAIELKVPELANAIEPRSADRNSALSKTAASGLFAFGAVVGGILFLEVRSKRVNSSSDIAHAVGLQVIGAVPLLPTKAITRRGDESPRYRRWRTMLNESMRGVMVRLIHEARTGQSQVVMVSSATAGEGKSTLATNLALAMARAGYRTLLVDCDLRRPTLGDLFDLPPAPGVSEVLRQEAGLEEVINTVYTDNLFVVTAGEWSPSHVGVLANGDTEFLFSEFRERFQFIVVDGSPILGVAEAQLLCRHADTVLLSVLRDVSSSPKILAACETLTAFGVRSLYAVLTGTSNSDHNYYYGGYGYAMDDVESN